jgi:hypothetical protein
MYALASSSVSAAASHLKALSWKQKISNLWHMVALFRSDHWTGNEGMQYARPASESYKENPYTIDGFVRC